MKLTIYDPILLVFILGAATCWWLLPLIGKYIRRKRGRLQNRSMSSVARIATTEREPRSMTRAI